MKRAVLHALHAMALVSVIFACIRAPERGEVAGLLHLCLAVAFHSATLAALIHVGSGGKGGRPS